MNENKLNQAATALASLDLSQEVEAITALQAAAAEIETAQEAAARRIREIADTLASQRAAAEAVADALVAGQDPSAAATAGPGGPVTAAGADHRRLGHAAHHGVARRRVGAGLRPDPAAQNVPTECGTSSRASTPGSCM